MQVATEDGGCYSGRWWRPLSMCWRSVEIDGDSSFFNEIQSRYEIPHHVRHSSPHREKPKNEICIFMKTHLETR